MPEYNYSPMFLKAHEALVRQLVELAKNQQVAELPFDTAEQARTARHLISNLKRSLAVNHPDMLWVYEALRTEVRYRNERYIIAVGPKHMLTNKMGRPLSLDLTQTRGGETGHIRALGDLEGAKQLAALATDPRVQRIIIDTTPLDTDFLAVMPGWTLEAEEPFTLRRTT
jgi:hypothetical protein